MNNFLQNRMHNSTNPNQGRAQKVLCVCSAGLLRSPTLARELGTLGYNTRAAGAVEEYALVPVDDVLVNWADVIICVEPAVYQRVLEKFPRATDKAHSLNIPDMYPFGHPELVETLKEDIETLEKEGVLNRG